MPAISRITCALFALMLLAIAANGGAQEFKLEETEFQKLTPEAAKHYAEAIDHLDHISETKALKAFVTAAEAAPKHIEIRFLVGKLGEWMARKSRFDEAVDYFETAKKSYQQVVDMGAETVGRPTIRRAEKRIEQVSKLIAQQSKIDADRQKIGEQVLNSYLRDIGYNIKKK